MSAKAQFLKKLQDQPPRTAAFDTKAEADIAAFRQRINQLHKSMDEWLAGTEIRTEATATSLIEFLMAAPRFRFRVLLCTMRSGVSGLPPFFCTGRA